MLTIVSAMAGDGVADQSGLQAGEAVVVSGALLLSGML